MMWYHVVRFEIFVATSFLHQLPLGWHGTACVVDGRFGGHLTVWRVTSYTALSCHEDTTTSLQCWVLAVKGCYYFSSMHCVVCFKRVFEPRGVLCMPWQSLFCVARFVGSGIATKVLRGSDLAQAANKSAQTWHRPAGNQNARKIARVQCRNVSRKHGTKLTGPNLC